MDKTNKKQPKASKGLADRMESFYFEITPPDGKAFKIGSEQKPTK